MRTLTLTATGRNVRIDYPNRIAFMYSRQPVIVTFISGAAGVTSVDVKLTCTTTGRTHTESRAPYSSRLEFDLSRIMQLLATDVDEITKRIDEGSGQGLSEPFSLEVSYTASNTTTSLLKTDIVGMYGALDQGEIYGKHTQRRLWVNFPQTFNLWRDSDGITQFVTDEAFVPTGASDEPCYECSFMDTLSALGEFDMIEALKRGIPPQTFGLSFLSRIEEGTETPQDLRAITLIPDLSRRQDGTYLRWLNRRGEMSYWLFTNSKLRVTTAVTDSFSRYYQGDPTVPENSIFQNPQKASYREAREMVLGAVGLSIDEFEDLCDLATSPVVERLMPNPDIQPEEQPSNPEDTELIYEGGNAATQDAEFLIESAEDVDTELEGGNAETREASRAAMLRAGVPRPDKWQRVNVVAGTFERNIRRMTPSRQDLEIIIELPERNTIQL